MYSHSSLNHSQRSSSVVSTYPILSRAQAPTVTHAAHQDLPVASANKLRPDAAAVRAKILQFMHAVPHIFDCLITYHAVWKYGSYNAAAVVLGLQGKAKTASRRVDRLAEVLGLTLIQDTDNSGVAITPEGQVVWESIEAILSALNALQ